MYLLKYNGSPFYPLCRAVILVSLPCSFPSVTKLSLYPEGWPGRREAVGTDCSYAGWGDKVFRAIGCSVTFLLHAMAKGIWGRRHIGRALRHNQVPTPPQPPPLKPNHLTSLHPGALIDDPATGSQHHVLGPFYLEDPALQTAHNIPVSCSQTEKRASQGRARQGRAGQGRSGQVRSGQGRAPQYSFHPGALEHEQIFKNQLTGTGCGGGRQNAHSKLWVICWRDLSLWLLKATLDEVSGFRRCLFCQLSPPWTIWNLAGGNWHPEMLNCQPYTVSISYHLTLLKLCQPHPVAQPMSG